MESRRQDFEAFVLKCGYSNSSLERAGDGYWFDDVHLMWRTWNAALDSLAVQALCSCITSRVTDYDTRRETRSGDRTQAQITRR